MRRRVYADTSVIGGCLDEEFEEASRRLFERFKAGKDILVVSELTLLELQRAPDAVKAVLRHVAEKYIEKVEFTEEAAGLAQSYIAVEVVGAAERIDAQHIATATVHRVDVLVSWNFRHIVNLDRIQEYNSVSLRNGYPSLEIRTPQEVVSYEEE